MKKPRTTKESLKNFSKFQKVFLVILVISIVLLGVLLPILLTTTSLYTVKVGENYVAGQLSNEDVIAPTNYSFIDRVATEQLQNEARESVLPFFSFSLSATYDSEKREDLLLTALAANDFEKVESYLVLWEKNENSQLISKYKKLREGERNETILLAKDALKMVLKNGIFANEDLVEIINDGYHKLTVELPINYNYKIDVIEKTVGQVTTDYALYNNFVSFSDNYAEELTVNQLQVLYEIINSVAVTNVYYDHAKTNELREHASELVPQVRVLINKGDYILKTDTIVTDQDLRTIERINEIRVDYPISTIIGKAVLLLVFTLGAIYTFFYLTNKKYRIATYTLIFLFLFVLVLVGTYFLLYFVSSLDFSYIDPFLPFLFVPLFITHITSKKRFGFIAGVLYAAFMATLPSSSIMTFFFLVAVSSISILFVRFGVNRIDMIYQTFYTAISCSVIVLIFHFIINTSWSYLFTSVIVISINVTVTYMLLAILIPITERIFNIPTVFRLHELSYTDTSLLVRLNQVAQGTFNHSKNVSDMAYMAAKAIGANAELARVGGLYHDVGKSEHPEYFVENQGGGPNIHDDLKGTLSAAIIKSHVKLGVEKGRDMGLPQEVLDIIAEHHGDDVIQYFYNAALREAEEKKVNVIVNEEDYRYSGNPPTSPEAAIVMLADGVEAATRTIKNPTALRYEKQINKILINKMTQKQLGDSGLNMTDIGTIQEEFILFLLGRAHQRIKYDKDDE